MATTGAPTYFLVGPDGRIAWTGTKWDEIKRVVAAVSE